MSRSDTLGFFQLAVPSASRFSVSRRRGLFSDLQVFSRFLPPMQMARLLVSVVSTAHLRLRIDEALSVWREDDSDWWDAWRTHKSCSASRRATLISHLYNDCEPAPEFLDQSPRRSPGPAVQPDQRRRRTDKLQILSWNPGPAMGSDPSALACHLNGPWHVICVPARGSDPSFLASHLNGPWHVICV